MTENYRVLIVGVGSIGERHLRCFAKTGRATVAFCEPNESLRATIADRYDVSDAHADVDAALSAGQFDAAVIATPAPYHVPIALQLARAGLHLLIEKPLSTSLDDVEPLRATVREKSLAAAVGYTHRAHPAIQAIKRRIDSGQFGRPLDMRISSGQAFYYFRPAYRDVYFADRALGGGAIQDGITHMYSVGEWLAGPITRLVTDAAHQFLDGVEVEDTVHTLARHGDLPASYTANLYQAPNETTVTVVCEEGTLRADYAASRVSWMKDPPGDSNAWQHEPVEVPERDALYVTQAGAFLDYVSGRSEPLCSLDEGVQTLRVNLASLRSVAEGNWQEVAG